MTKVDQLAEQPIPTPDEIIARANALVPLLRERAEATEASRCNLPENVAEFRKAGFYRILQPSLYQGYEMDFETFFHVIIAIGSGCPSSAWCVCLLSIHNWLVGWWPEQAQDEIFGSDGHALTPIVLAPTGTAEKVDGGYRLTGEWTYASGIDSATFVAVAGLITGLPEGETSPPVTLVIPIGQAQIIDDWYTLGLRGTGSKKVTFDGLFVPEHMTYVLAHSETREAPGKQIHSNPIYHGFPRVPFFAMGGTAPALGAARLMIDSYVDRLKTHKSMYLPDAHAQMQTSQIRLGRAETIYEMAHSLFFNSVREYYDLIVTQAPITFDHRTRYRAHMAEIVQRCVDIVDMLMADAGTGAFKDGSPMQRAFRDVHMIQSHVAMNLENAAENFAKVRLGFDPIPPLF